MLEVVILKKYFRLLVITNFLFLFCSLPKLTIYAAHIDLKKCSLPHGGTFTVSDLYTGQEYAFSIPSSEGNVYLLTTENGNNDEMYFISDSPFSGASAYECNGNTFYMTSLYINADPGPFVHPAEISVPYIHCPWSNMRSFYGQIFYGDSSEFEACNVEGQITNPIESDDIGTLILSKTKMYEESNGNDVNDLYNLWSWKNKTSSGFSLSKNKYKETYIQVRVESKCVIYSDFRHKKVKCNFDNYGEKGMLFDSLSYESQPLKVSYLTDIPKVLPLTHAESHNPLFVGYDYTLYFRVICKSDSDKWYSGGWRACDCNADIINGQTDTSQNGYFNENDEWIPEPDDGHNQIESGSESVNDTDDARDDFSGVSKQSDLSVENAKNSIKDMLEMVGFIPTMIGTLFSFLPGWCLNMLASFFVALCVLIVYKLIRG